MCVSSWVKVRKSGLPFGIRWAVVDRELSQKMKELVGWILGRREAQEEYKVMMHTQGLFRRMRGMRKDVSIDAHSMGVCAHRTTVHVFCAPSC
jgi:hypothetical protein